MTVPDDRSPSVSVVIPTYQRREYVTRAARSVLAQTFADFELIVVDDWADRRHGRGTGGLDPRVRYHWQENRGTGAARNAGIGLAQGEIVAFLDSDNRWLPHHLAVVTEVLTLHPGVIVACTCPGQDVHGGQPPADARLVELLVGSVLADAIFGDISCSACRLGASCRGGGFTEELTFMEDADLFLRLSARGPFAMLDHRTVVIQLTQGSRLQRGIKRGTALPAFEAVSRRGVETVSAASRSDRVALEAMAQGRLRYAAVMRALTDHDDEAVATNLVQACHLLPELSRQPWSVTRRMRRLVAGEYPRAWALTAELWPDQTSDTALFLRFIVRRPRRSPTAGRRRRFACCAARLPVPRFGSPSATFRYGARWRVPRYGAGFIADRDRPVKP